MNDLQKEIYKTWELWKDDKKNESFYDCYIQLCVGDYSEQRDFYLKYWENLKKYEERRIKINGKYGN